MTTFSKIGLIADDFTGAMDSGAQFSYSELGVHFRFTGLPTSDVEIINTASREIPETEAVARVQAACHSLAGRSLFKKIDSTLRGHVGAEIEGVLSASTYRKAVICPAAPLQGRTVQNGVLYVNGLPLEQTAFKDDPIYPAKTSRIAELVGKPVSHLSLDLVRGPQNELVDAISRADHALLTTDAETLDDLAVLAHAILDAQALPCGAFGLAKAYLLALNVPSVEHPAFKVDGRVLVIVGSANQTARQQVKRLEIFPDCLVLKLDASSSPKEIKSTLATLPSDKRILVLYANQEKTIRTPEWLRFGQTVSEVALSLLERFQPQTILAVGGETVTYFCQQAQARSIRVLGEAAPGIPFGRIQGGLLNQRLLVTKAGGFGNPDTLVNIIYSAEKK
jgi:uncharacterized protein YgbK (DUF1537 family)